MAKVPYQSFATAQPSQIATPSIHIQTPTPPTAPAAAFGGAVADAVKGLGGSLEKTGDELFKKAVALKELENETVAKEADAQYMIKVGERHAEFSALKGEAASKAYPSYMRDLDLLRNQMRGDLPNDSAKKMFDGPSLSTFGRTVFSGAGHAASEHKAWAAGAAEGRIDALTQSVFTDPTNDLNAERAIRGVASETHALGDISGWSGEKREMEISKRVSSIWAHRITGLARTAPVSAETMLEESRGKMRIDDFERVERTVQAQVRSVGARFITDEATGDLFKPSEGKPEKTLEEMIKDGERLAEERSKDPLLKDYVRDRIISTYNRHRTVQRDFEFDNRNAIEGALMTGGPGGRLPITLEELKADPKAATAFDALSERWQRYYIGQLAKNSKGDRVLTETGLRRWNEIKGMSQADPEAFLNLNIVDEELPISIRKPLLDLQRKIKEKPEQDPRVMRAMGGLSRDLQNANITRDRKTQYFQFVGALQDALEQHLADKKKPATPAEAHEIGRQLLTTTANPAGSLWNPYNKDKLFELTPPRTEAAEIRAAIMADHPGVEVTDDQVQRIYVAKRLRELFGGRKEEAVGAPAMPPPAPPRPRMEDLFKKRPAAPGPAPKPFKIPTGMEEMGL